MRKLAFVVLGLAVCAACGSDSKSPTSPTTPTPTNITITGSASLRNGRAETYTASVTGCTWGGDAPQYATVNASTGQVSPIGVGRVTIWCDAQGARGTKLLTILPDFQGSWTGSYIVDTCDQSGWAIASKVCTDVAPVRRVLPFNLNLTQDSDRVSGTFSLGTNQGTLQGPVDGNGEATLTGTASIGDLTFTTTWRLRSDQVARLSGSMTQLIRSNTAVGEARIASSVRDAVR